MVCHNPFCTACNSEEELLNSLTDGDVYVARVRESFAYLPRNIQSAILTQLIISYTYCMYNFHIPMLRPNPLPFKKKFSVDNEYEEYLVTEANMDRYRVNNIEMLERCIRESTGIHWLTSEENGYEPFLYELYAPV